MRALILGLVLAAGAAPAIAQERPPGMPTRDVAVTYRVPDSPPTVDTVAWLVAEGRVRTDGRALTTRATHLIDTRSGNVTVFVDAHRNYHDLGRVAAAMLEDYSFGPASGRFTRERTDTVAGQSCTVWRIERPDTDLKRACITADGVPLRLVVGEGADAETQYEATRVTYGAQDPARFRVPAGYQPLSGPGRGR